VDPDCALLYAVKPACLPGVLFWCGLHDARKIFSTHGPMSGVGEEKFESLLPANYYFCFDFHAEALH
jgi:hypothetical protein